MSKRLSVGLIALTWALIAVALILSKEYILATGQTVLLETEPVDPRDLLRGDYVVLNYKISSINLTNILSSSNSYPPGQTIFVLLEPAGKFWQVKEVKSEQFTAAQGIIVNGRVVSSSGSTIRVRYGIESYFVPEGKGRQIEQYMRRGAQSVVSVEAAVDKNGNAMIRRVLIDDLPVRFD